MPELSIWSTATISSSFYSGYDCLSTDFANLVGPTMFSTFGAPTLSTSSIDADRLTGVNIDDTLSNSTAFCGESYGSSGCNLDLLWFYDTKGLRSA